jgi:hypothetical protein
MYYLSLPHARPDPLLLLSADAIVTGDLVVLDASRRNRNFKIIRNGGPSLFVKEMREGQPDAMTTLRREAACYEAARNDPALSRLMAGLGTALASASSLTARSRRSAMPAADRTACRA